MLDAFALTNIFARPPNEELLAELGWQAKYKPNGEFSRLVLFEGVQANEPQLTIYPSPKGFWYIKASVGLTSWLEGSNVRLVTGSEISDGLEMLSDFVKEKSGINFDAENAIVAKVEFTRDTNFDENRMMRIITDLKKSDVCKYIVQPYKTGITFQNIGKDKNQLNEISSRQSREVSKEAKLNAFL